MRRTLSLSRYSCNECGIDIRPKDHVVVVYEAICDRGEDGSDSLLNNFGGIGADKRLSDNRHYHAGCYLQFFPTGGAA